jgi:hypothetical protein
MTHTNYQKIKLLIIQFFYYSLDYSYKSLNQSINLSFTDSIRHSKIYLNKKIRNIKYKIPHNNVILLPLDLVKLFKRI